MIEVQLSGLAGELGCVSTCRDVSVSELKRIWQETKWDGCGTSVNAQEATNEESKVTVTKDRKLDGHCW